MTAYLISGQFTLNGVGINGATVTAFRASRFSSPPTLGTVAPGVADAGPITTSNAFGTSGSWQLASPTLDDVYVAVTYNNVNYWQYYSFAPQTFNVKDPVFGAKGDGITDDTAAIQSALQAAVTGGGGKVFAPPTTNGYGGSSTITVPANVSLEVWNSTFPPVTVQTGGDLIQHLGNSGTYYTSGATNFGFSFNGANAQDVITTYRKFGGGAALYAEDSNQGAANGAGKVDSAFRIERHNGELNPATQGPQNGATSIAANFYDFVNGNPGIGPFLQIVGLNAGGNPEAIIKNTNQASPNAPWNALYLQDNQQTGSPNNVSLQISNYQDNTAGWTFLDGQRSNAAVASIKKDASGAYFDMNNASGTNRIRLKSGSTGARGYIRLWDAGAGVYQYVYINNGAWVISTTEPT